MKICFVRFCFCCVCILAPAAMAWGQTPAPADPAVPAPAPTPAPAPDPVAPPVVDPPKAEPPVPPEPVQEKIYDTRVYGYLNATIEEIAPVSVKRPLAYDRAANKVLKLQEPMNFGVDAFVMIQGTIGNRYRYFLNVAALGAGDPIESASIELRNAWVEASLYGQTLAVRAGRMYRRFGLYNEILDATPTFIGIKEPEILDEDHLMITRTTNLMLLGTRGKGAHKIEYSITTGSDERESNQIPLGADINYNYEQTLKIGVSYYDSVGKAKSGVAVGEGSPKGGVANWMAEDRYRVIDAYAQIVKGPLIAQLEYCVARHNAKRDPTAILPLADPSAHLSPVQYRRFFTDPFDDTPPTEMDVIQNAEYTARAAYLRLGYELAGGAFTPYIQIDYYKNPEIVPLEDFGGDDEAGFDDRGRFYKGTLGLMYRPISPIAFKLEYSSHLMKWGGTSYADPNLRASFAYFWEL